MELRGLVSELDQKLASARAHGDAGIEILPDDPNAGSPRTERMSTFRTWLGFGLLGFAAGLAMVISFGLLAAAPWESDCGYAQDVCEVAELDIDALRVAIPNSDLIAMLPDIDTLDPNDVLTAGDIFEMDRFAHLDLEQLLTESDIALLLGVTR